MEMPSSAHRSTHTSACYCDTCVASELQGKGLHWQLMFQFQKEFVVKFVIYFTFSGHSVRLLGQKKDGGRRLGGARLDLPKIRKNPLIEIISINTG